MRACAFACLHDTTMSLSSATTVRRAASAASALALAGLAGFAPPAMAQSRAIAAPAYPAGVAPRTSFAEASALFRSGRYPAAYGHFVRLANEGDRAAARVALVMHRHGVALFGSAWDATTEELEQWALLAGAADRADIDATPHPRAPSGTAVTGVPGGAVLAVDTFRPDRKREP